MYAGQFRAMFVRSCVVVKGETMTYRAKGRKNKVSWRSSRHMVPAHIPQRSEAFTGDEGDTYHPVKCAECGTTVRV